MKLSNYQQFILFLFSLFLLPSCGNGNNAAGNDNSISVNRDSIDKKGNESSQIVSIPQKEPLVLEVVTRKKLA
ncbi:MAG: hypothetical protein IPO21_10270 [Bacteroidales bacterium]|nr:hypothetical protein [Bacteroidales bacterium]